MRPFTRFLCVISPLILCLSFFYLTLASSTIQSPGQGLNRRSSHNFASWFPFRSPAALFSPSATITLTDDNSTFFATWPAAFGPLVPPHGLTGRIWIGSGFGDDYLKRQGIAASVEGELGCSDIRGWMEYTPAGVLAAKNSPKSSNKQKEPLSDASVKSQRQSSQIDETASEWQEDDDGTDDNLHFPLPRTHVHRQALRKLDAQLTSGREHADIQSIQESAEIAGKIALLSRGGCGFAEKVKWAQRRGAVAVIVADNVRGGPLIRMYAREDTSNITIPSVFTSHTTAHLLSSLIPPEGSSESTTASKDAKLASKETKSKSETYSSGGDAESNAITPYGYSKETSDGDNETKSGRMHRILSALGLRNNHEETDTRSSSKISKLKWMKVENFDEDEAWKNAHENKKKASHVRQSSDGFNIGVQDWRDPDIVRFAGDKQEADAQTLSSSTSSTATQQSSGTPLPLKGGNITPGSGEYEHAASLDSATDSSGTNSEHFDLANDGSSAAGGRSWFSISKSKSGPDEEGFSSDSSRKSGYSVGGSQSDPRYTSAQQSHNFEDTHDGLWVTLTLTEMNASPFLNTLFVLVISPLVTLAIVYSLLLLRSRIRRRRWRAPKSVVERLPVRVYQTLSSRTTSNQVATAETAPTPTTPLLANSQPADVIHRPRSRTVCGAIGSPRSTSSKYGSIDTMSPEEKAHAGLAEWRRRYTGKQVECVVCLEEYVDGVSRVMSLPCGHEFHAECITPWLTTRRRTCPICKSDIVRSFGQSPSSSDDNYQDMTDEEIQAQVAETVNYSESASLPIPEEGAEGSESGDVESMSRPPASPSNSRPSPRSWLTRGFRRSLERFGAGQAHDREEAPDRNR